MALDNPLAPYSHAATADNYYFGPNTYGPGGPYYFGPNPYGEGGPATYSPNRTAGQLARRPRPGRLYTF